MTDSTSDDPRRTFNAGVIEQFRGNDGQVGPPFEGMSLILVHAVGRKTGTVHVTPLVWFFDDGRYVVSAGAGGAPAHPAWYHNLMAHPEVDVEVGHGPQARVERARVHVDEATGQERERLWQRTAETSPGATGVQRALEGIRTVPVLMLTPIVSRHQACGPETTTTARVKSG